MSEKDQKSRLSRRDFIKGMSGGVLGSAALISTISKCTPEKKGPYGSFIRGPEKVKVSFKINGMRKSLELDPQVTLLDAIRNQLDYTGTKQVCNRGECGACTVILNGRTVPACSILALDAEGAEIETVEGLADGDQLHPVQESFIKHDALQCGFCTPGFIMSSAALLESNPTPSMEEIKEGVAGNFCRCGTYPNIFKAVDDAAKKMSKGG